MKLANREGLLRHPSPLLLAHKNSVKMKGNYFTYISEESPKVQSNQFDCLNPVIIWDNQQEHVYKRNYHNQLMEKYSVDYQS